MGVRARPDQQVPQIIGIAVVQSGQCLTVLHGAAGCHLKPLVLNWVWRLFLWVVRLLGTHPMIREQDLPEKIVIPIPLSDLYPDSADAFYRGPSFEAFAQGLLRPIIFRLRRASGQV